MMRCLSALVGLLHGALDAAVAQHLVAVDVYLVHLYLGVLVDHDVDNHLVLLAQVFSLVDLAGHFLKALVLEVFFHNHLDAVGNVGGHLVAHLQPKLLGDVLLLAFFHAHIVDDRHTRLLAQHKLEPCLVAIYLVDLDLHLGKEALVPESLGSIGDLVARDVDALAHGQPRVAYDDVVLVVVYTSDLDASYLILLRVSREDDLGIVDGVVHSPGRVLRPAVGSASQ